jgi:hypothetical protein
MADKHQRGGAKAAYHTYRALDTINSRGRARAEFRAAAWDFFVHAAVIGVGLFLFWLLLR